MTDCATKRIWLAEAQLALHQLQTGTKETKITFGPGKGVEYSQANIEQLRTYVADLQAQVDECDGKTAARRGPIRFVF